MITKTKDGLFLFMLPKKQIEINPIKVSEQEIIAQIGKVWASWLPDKYDFPCVKYKGFNHEMNEKVRFISRNVLILVLKETLNIKTPSIPLQSGLGLFKPNKKGTSHTNEIPRISKWMREIKLYVTCRFHDGSGRTYLARRKFDQSDKKLITDYAGFCAACPIRDRCDKPCGIAHQFDHASVKADV